MQDNRIIQENDYTLYHGDCLDVMKDLPDNSIDAVITDPPYGTTACKWDSVIPFEPMWEQLKRITRERSAICLFGSQPFTSALVMSNPQMFKYQWLWKKERGTGFALSDRRPLMICEDVNIFYNKQVSFQPQKKKLAKPYRHVLPKHKGGYTNNGVLSKSVKDGVRQYKTYTHSSPTQLLEFKRDQKTRHPTQKPVDLLAYLIKTYTKENETVLDFTMGSGSTGVACIRENRKFIGIEKEKKYFDIAQERIQAEINKHPLLNQND